MVNDQEIKILDDKGAEVGHIFTPSGSGRHNVNCIQVCGFTEAFDLWGCGIYKGKKDIQLLYDDVKLKGTFHEFDLDKCLRCYQDPCVCENPSRNATMPFRVKREKEIEGRIQYTGLGKVAKTMEEDLRKNNG